MNKIQKKTNLNDRFKINKNAWASGYFVPGQSRRSPNRGFASGPHWGLSSPSPWQYVDGVRGEQGLKPFLCPDGRVATGEGRLAKWCRSKFVLPHSASRLTKLATKQALIFTALHVMQTQYSDENSVRPSVRLSVRLSHAWIVTKRKKDLSRFLYHTKDNLA